MAQRQIPGGEYLNEGSNQKQIPGGVYINETSGASGAVMASDGFGVATATAALTTSILMSAAGVGVATATADLAGNSMASSGVAVATGTAALTTAIKMATAGVGVATGTAALTTQPAIGWDTPPLKNNAGTLLTSETGVVINIYNNSTGALVLRKTGLASDAVTAVIQVRDITGTLVAATTYSYEVVLSTHGRRLPTATAA